MLVFIILFTTCVLLISYLIFSAQKNLDYWKKRNVKHLKPLPIIGNMMPLVKKEKTMPDFVQDVYSAFPNERYTGFFQFMSPVLMIRDPDLIKSITIKHFEHFVDHTGFIPDDVDLLWNKNLFSTKGERWRELRQTLTPAFTSSKMRSMFLLMQECANNVTNFYKNQNKTIIEVELQDLFSRVTNDVIASTAFGIKIDSINNKNNEFLQVGRELADFRGWKRFKFTFCGKFPRITRFFNIKMINNKVGSFFRSIIDETIKIRQEKNIIRPDLIHLLMLSRNGKLKYEEYLNIPDAGFATAKESGIKNTQTNLFLSNEDITAQALVFFLGGFDTVSHAISFAGYEIVANPNVQAKLRQEVINTYSECGGKITYEKLQSMKYLDMVVSESLRKWPQAHFLDRVCTKPFEIPAEKPGESDLKLNVGDALWVPVYGLHRDPNYYPNPDVFDPERFSDESAYKIDVATYLPFGIGPRNCIGSRFALLETKLLLYTLLTEFEFVSIGKTQIPLKIRKDTIMLEPEGGFNIGLKRSPVY